jgi:hypothetical protein
MAASLHSWDFLLLRLRELRLPLLRGSASRTSGPTAKSIADILPRGVWQSKISGSAPPPIYEIGSAIQLALGSIITNTPAAGLSRQVVTPLGRNGYSFSTETSVALITANTSSPSFSFIRSTEPVVIIDVTIPAAVRMTTSDTTLSETIFSILPGKRFRILMLIVVRP